MELHTDAPVRLNLGAGAMKLDGWFSVGLEEQHDIHADVRDLAPMPDDFADEAMAIHVLEHINRWQTVATLREWRRVLKPGARLIIELPELYRCCRNVLDNPDPRRGIWGLFGDPGYQSEPMTHRWCFSEAELRQVLDEAGFRKIRLKDPEFHGRKRLRDIRAECIK